MEPVFVIPIEKEVVQTGKVGTSAKEEKFPYREALGALTYLMVGTQSHNAYAVGVVSRKLESPLKEVNRIFRYLRGNFAGNHL